MGIEHEFKCDECAAETNGHICERCLAGYHEQQAEIKRLRAIVDKLAAINNQTIRDRPETTLRRLRDEAAKAAKGK